MEYTKLNDPNLTLPERNALAQQMIGTPAGDDGMHTDDQIVAMVAHKPKYFDGRHLLEALIEIQNLGVGGIPDSVKEMIRGQYAEQEELEDWRDRAQGNVQEGMIEVDDGAMVSIAEDDTDPDGAYVEAWVWVEGDK